MMNRFLLKSRRHYGISSIEVAPILPSRFLVRNLIVVIYDA